MKYCVIKDTIKVIDGSENPIEIMLQNAQNAGFTEIEVEILTEEEYQARKSIRTLDEVKVSKINELDNACKQATLGYFKATVDALEYSFSNDIEAQSNFKDAMWALESNKATVIKWTCYDINGDMVRLDLDLIKLSDVNIARLTHQQTQVSKFRDILEPQVNSATTIAEVELIVW